MGREQNQRKIRRFSRGYPEMDSRSAKAVRSSNSVIRRSGQESSFKKYLPRPEGKQLIFGARRREKSFRGAKNLASKSTRSS